MLFDKKVSIETSSYRRRYLANMYSRINTVKNAYNDYNVASSNYDPYQLKQYAEEVEYDPFPHKSIHRRRVLEEKGRTPPAKRLRYMAVSAVESVSNALIYGAFAAYNYVCSDKKTITYHCSEDKPISHEWSGKNLSQNNQDDKMSQDDDYVMDFTPTRITQQQSATTEKMSGAPTESITPPNNFYGTFKFNKFKFDTNPSASYVNESLYIADCLNKPVYNTNQLNDTLYDPNCLNESTYNSELLTESVHSMSDTVYETSPSASSLNQSVYKQNSSMYGSNGPVYDFSSHYNMRRKLPIVRESFVYETIHSLNQPPKRSFDDIDDSWGIIDKVNNNNKVR